MVIHGLRMPLFVMMSGFFTAMLWRKRGLRSLVQHRFRRVFLPLFLGLFTIVPLMNWIIGLVGEETSQPETNAGIVDFFTDF